MSDDNDRNIKVSSLRDNNPSMNRTQNPRAQNLHHVVTALLPLERQVLEPLLLHPRVVRELSLELVDGMTGHDGFEVVSDGSLLVGSGGGGGRRRGLSGGGEGGHSTDPVVEKERGRGQDWERGRERGGSRDGRTSLRRRRRQRA